MAYTFKHGDRPLDGFVIQRGVGRGGFGEVYYAISDGGREVALKYLRDNSDVELRGVTHCMNLKSPHLVTIFDVKKNADGEYFIIMEYIAGPSLAELLVAEPNGLGVEKTAFLVREIGKGLAYLHDRGIVHRDMKPANIFYEDGHVKIGDYGLSKFISVSRHSAQTTSVGTVHYMAPEVGSGNYHRGIDIYALGVMLYEMLLGKVPFEGSSMGEVLMKHLTEQPEVEGLPRPFGAVIRKALAKDPKDRYQNVNEMIDRLLDVGEVRDSLAGFNPNTITAIPRRPAADPMRTPVPSPNPSRPPMPPPGVGIGPHAPNLPPHVARRLGRVSEKVQRRMDKLAGRRHRPRRPRGGPNAAMAAMAHNQGLPQRFALAFIVTVGAAVALGLLVGGLSEEPALGAAAGMMVFVISIGIRGAAAATRWLGASAQPGWVQKIVRVACCAPPMAIANTPVWATWNERGFGLPVGLLAAVLFACWDKRLTGGARGELSFANAFYLGLFGLITGGIATSMFDGPDDFILVAAAILAAVSVVIEAVAWFLPPNTSAAQAGAKPAAPDNAVDIDEPASSSGSEPFAAAVAIGFPGRKSTKTRRRSHIDDQDIPFGVAVEPGTPVSGTASTVPPYRPRSGFERGFFSVLAFILLLGMVTNIIFAALGGGHRANVLAIHGMTTYATVTSGAPGCVVNLTFAHIVAAGACGAFMLFCMSKLTLRKRRGFWRESLCPFIIAMVMTGLCANITAVNTFRFRDAQLAAAIVGIVFSSLALAALLVAWTWPRKPGVARHAAPTMQAFIGGESDSSAADKPADDPPDVGGAVSEPRP